MHGKQSLIFGIVHLLSHEEGATRWCRYLVDHSKGKYGLVYIYIYFFLVCLYVCHKKKVRPGGAPKQEMLVGQFIPTGASHLIDEEGDAMLFGQFCY